MGSTPKPKDVTEIALCRCPSSGPLPASPLLVSTRDLQTGQCTASAASSVRSESWGSGTNLRWSVVAEIKRACRLRSTPQGRQAPVVVASVVAPPLGALGALAAVVVAVAAVAVAA